MTVASVASHWKLHRTGSNSLLDPDMMEIAVLGRMKTVTIRWDRHSLARNELPRTCNTETTVRAEMIKIDPDAPMPEIRM